MVRTESWAKIADQNERRKVAEGRLARIEGGQQRLEQLKTQKRFVLETFGMGLKLELEYFPPQMRRKIYETLRLNINVYGDGTIRIGGNLDASVMQLTRDVEDYARKLKELEQRLGERSAGLDGQGLMDLADRELKKVR